jgi:mono/diheme cytochrome c family protein
MTLTPPDSRPSLRNTPCLLAFLVGLASGSPCAAAPLPADHAEKMARGQEVFSRHVRPLLLERCVKCHGGDKTRGGLSLLTREALLKGGDDGPVVVPFDARASRLYQLAAHLDKPPMPPPDQGPRLTAEQLRHLAAWIDLGAPYDRPLLDKGGAKKPLVVTEEDRRFWSFRPLARAPLPPVRDTSWGRNAIDRFALAALEARGLAPNPSADRRTLIRRASFDLTGLPPEPEEVRRFLADTGEDAYEKLLDRLLSSPHFGERWARHWLDVARFAESHGFEHDYDRPTAYHYRDFVIRAFNQDLPYDTFVRWQLAGDEYAPDNPLALMATGFLAAGVHSTQITANQVEKERYDELDDMLRTTGTALLGLTVGCARCHDHKYDPIPTRDYYRLLSTFTTTVRSEVELDVDPEASRLARAKFDAEQAQLDGAVKRYETQELPGKLAQWLAARKKQGPRPRWEVLDPVSTRSQGGATLTKQPDGSLLAGGVNPNLEGYTFVAHTTARGITAIRLEALAHPSFVRGGPGRASNGNFALTEFAVKAAPLDGKGPEVPVKLVGARATFEQAGLPVRAAIDNNPQTAWAVDPQFGKDHAAVFDTDGDVGFAGGSVLTFRMVFTTNVNHSIGRPRLALSTAPRPVGLDGESMPPAVVAVLGALGAAPPTAGQQATLLNWYRTTDPQWQALFHRAEEHKKQGSGIGKTKVLISTEGLPAVRLHTQGGDFLEQTHFLKRGDPNQKEGVASPGFLQVLTRDPEGEMHWQVAPPAGWRTSFRRRVLAAWMTDADRGAGHLLARVIVNRLWQHHMGRGLVGTPSDFGLQGERPTHPELLDWLAGELIANGWHLKPIHKLILSSAAYRQGSRYDKGRAAVDVDNKLYWRRVPRRLEAEVIRDAFLAVSGTLDGRPFGPGTLDPNHRRRSIYFFVKRSQLVPSMVLFDGPDALQGVEQRTTTTIAPQALLVMNNQMVRACAEALARRIAPAPDTPPADAVRAGYEVALARPPSAKELADSVAFLREQVESYRAGGKADAEHLGLTDFCQVLMGLNEFIYID